MTFTTPNGIRYPNDPTAYADLIQFFKEMAEDVDTKFVPKTGQTSHHRGVDSPRRSGPPTVAPRSRPRCCRPGHRRPAPSSSTTTT